MVLKAYPLYGLRSASTKRSSSTLPPDRTMTRIVSGVATMAKPAERLSIMASHQESVRELDEQHQLAREVVAVLRQARIETRVERLAIFAPPAFLGRLREAMDSKTLANRGKMFPSGEGEPVGLLEQRQHGDARRQARR